MKNYQLVLSVAKNQHLAYALACRRFGRDVEGI